MTGTLATAIVLSLLGFALGASACILLLVHPAHRRAWNTPLLTALGFLALRQLAFAVGQSGLVANGPAATVGTICLFLFWPALALYMRRATSNAFGFPRTLVVAVPALLFLFLVLLLMPDRWFPLAPGGSPQGAPPSASRTIPGVLLMLAYAGAAMRRSWGHTAPDGVALSSLRTRWLRLLSTGAAVIPVVVAVTLVIDFVVPELRGVMGICNVAAEVAFLQLIFPAALLNSRVLSDAPDGGELMARSVPSPAQTALLKRHVLELMNTERAYREHDLRVSDVAAAIGVPAHVLSSVINREFGSNFADFVNGYRIREAERLLLDPEFRQFTILSIALEVGFASKAPFNRAFKRQTGLTPSEYQRRKLKETCGSS